VKDWEVIIVDNHSQDDTRQMVESLRDERMRFIEVDNEGVVAFSRNTGWRQARSEYIALLDSDDWWDPRKLEASLAELARGADIIYHDLYLVHSANQRFFFSRARTRDLRRPIYDELLFGGNALTNSSVVVRRSILEKIGGISEDRALIAFEDYDAWLRIARVTERFVRLARPLGYYWKGGANLSTPERTIRNLDHFRNAYLPGGSVLLPAWFHYGYGRAYYHLGSYDLAFEHMRCALRGRLVFSKVLKAVLTLIASSGRRLLGAR
jgi:glycosyltransferase involved in cell wall biosynthesis